MIKTIDYSPMKLKQDTPKVRVLLMGAVKNTGGNVKTDTNGRHLSPIGLASKPNALVVKGWI